jgi:N-acetylmuramoyl-L-alanine amidase
MRKLIKVIAVPVLCCIILCILFFMVDFRSNGEEVSVPRAIDVRKKEPVIAVWQEEAVPIAIEETEESSRNYRRNVERRCGVNCSCYDG